MPRRGEDGTDLGRSGASRFRSFLNLRPVRVYAWGVDDSEGLKLGRHEVERPCHDSFLNLKVARIVAIYPMFRGLTNHDYLPNYGYIRDPLGWLASQFSRSNSFPIPRGLGVDRKQGM